MANAAITTLINTISTVVLDSTQTDSYQDELYNELARLANPNVLVQTTAAFIAATRGSTTVTLPSASGVRSAIMLFFDDTQLAQARYDEAHYFDPAWRDSTGKPVVFMTDTIDRVKFAVIPTPNNDGQTIGVSTPFVFTTWPAENFAVIAAYADTAYSGTNYADTHIAVAFEVISRELGRDSDHTDNDASIVAKQMADFFWRLSFPDGV